MTSLSKTLAALRATRSSPTFPAAEVGRLKEWSGFAPNPGQLAARVHLPANLPPKAPLVVVLHGCTQNAVVYDIGSGWSRLADRMGFALLFPEQVASNNANLCFNWFEPGDTARHGGEVASIHAMIEAMIAEHGLDRDRIFVTGLSAGGAMTASLLAACPDVFAAGAIIAGLPHGVAKGVPQALAIMRGRGIPGPSVLRGALAGSMPGPGGWPRVSIWHGSADKVVVPANAQALLVQWQGVLGAEGAPERLRIDGAECQVWRRADGRSMLELWTVPGMEHGTPIDPSGDGLGRPLPYMLDRGVSSTARIARFFGLLDEAQLGLLAQEARAAPGRTDADPDAKAAPMAARNAMPGGAELSAILDRALPGRTGLNGSIKEVIDTALRKAGLR